MLSSDSSTLLEMENVTEPMGQDNITVAPTDPSDDNDVEESLDPFDEDNDWASFAYAEEFVRWAHGARDGLTGHHATLHEVAAGKAAFVHYGEDIIRIFITQAILYYCRFR